MSDMSIYAEIKKYVKEKYNILVQPCWIADAKERCGLKVRKAWNRKDDTRVKPCPNKAFEPIKDALQHFNMI